MTTPMTDGLRACSKCGERKCWPASFRSGTSATCKSCWGAHQKAWRDANRVTLRQNAQAKREERNRLRSVRPNHFATTMRHLETRWGVPYATWTRDQHARHSEILRRLAGLDDATPQTEDRAA